jgi:hypothetical protein
MKLFAISDLHVGFPANRLALAGLSPHPEDWLILGGDMGETKAAWCEERCRTTAARLATAVEQIDCPSVLINHFPLCRELAVLPMIPRFSIWCGTRRTHDWHRRFRAEAVVFGHLHIRQSRVIDGVRFEEVSLGYPRQWSPERSMDSYLRQILPPRGAP